MKLNADWYKSTQRLRYLQDNPQEHWYGNNNNWQ